jgi:hypothetical protein
MADFGISIIRTSWLLLSMCGVCSFCRSIRSNLIGILRKFLCLYTQGRSGLAGTTIYTRRWAPDKMYTLFLPSHIIKLSVTIFFCHKESISHCLTDYEESWTVLAFMVTAVAKI